MKIFRCLEGMSYSQKVEGHKHLTETQILAFFYARELGIFYKDVVDTAAFCPSCNEKFEAVVRKYNLYQRPN